MTTSMGGDGRIGLPEDSDFVVLISSEGDEYVVSERAAYVSGTIKALLAGPGDFAEKRERTIELPDIRSEILELVCDYFYFKLHHSNVGTAVPDFDVPPELAYELLIAANYLET